MNMEPRTIAVAATALVLAVVIGWPEVMHAIRVRRVARRLKAGTRMILKNPECGAIIDSITIRTAPGLRGDVTYYAYPDKAGENYISTTVDWLVRSGYRIDDRWRIVPDFDAI